MKKILRNLFFPKKRNVKEISAEVKRQQKYNLPVIGHFADKSVRFESINQACRVTGISNHLIFESAIGKIKSAKGTLWEYENGMHWLKYKAQYIRQQKSYMRLTGFNG
jgi:hypothetical protein